MGLHDEVYARYQEVHESHVNPPSEQRRPWMREYAKLNVRPYLHDDTRTVLEIACGAGHLLDAMTDWYYVGGTDLCSENVETCRQRGFMIWDKDVLKRPLPHSFDAIVAMGLIEHLPKESLLPSLRAVKSMLRPGGVALFATLNMDCPAGPHDRYLDITHELGFTRESLAEVGRMVFPKVAVYPITYPQEKPRTVKQRLVAAVRPWYKRAYRAHLRLMQSTVVDTWYDAPGLVGVFRAD
jgi:cyclopropane fatty-acyl-phospholipid synthase-like methyltransferase